jgi:hypothetical protein
MMQFDQNLEMNRSDQNHVIGQFEVTDEDSQVSRDSDTQSQETVIELSKSEDTVVEAKIRSEGDTNKTEANADSLEEDKDIKDDTLSASLLQTDQALIFFL